MAAKSSVRLIFGSNKYAALHLLLCRWIRLYGDREKEYCYVTLGGTELKDILSIAFVDTALIRGVWSYESDANRFEVAKETAIELANSGIDVQVRQATFWSHKRDVDLPHIFFVDIQGICAWSDYDARFGELFQNEIIREGDCLLITSHLGHNRGLAAIREYFGGGFAVLGIDDRDDALVRSVFRRAHPSITLFKALSLNGLQSELALRCFGVIKYRDGTPMGIYGYTISGGRTDLARFVDDSSTSYFDVGKGRFAIPSDF
jgi:hypothetical protein